MIPIKHLSSQSVIDQALELLKPLHSEFQSDVTDLDEKQLLLQYIEILVQRYRTKSKILEQLEQRVESQHQTENYEKRLRFALRSANLYMWDYNLVTKQTIFSNGHESLYGLQPGETIPTDEKFWDLIHPEDRALLAEKFERALETGLSFRHEYRVIWPDGSIHWLSCFVQVQGNISGGEINHLDGIVTDITYQKDAELNLLQSLQLLKAAERIAKIGSWAVDLEKGEVFWSDSLYEIFGCDPKTFVPTLNSGLAFVHPEDRARVRKDFGLAIHDGAAYTIQYRIVKGDEIRVARQSATVFKDSTGRPIRFIGVTQDITEQVQAEARRRQDELQYHQILDAIPDLVLVKGKFSQVQWANKAFRQYYGMSNEELKGIIDAPFSEPDYTKKFVTDDEYVFKTGKTLDIPNEPVNRADGAVRLFHTVKSPIFDEKGDVVMTVGISRDITDRNNAELLVEQQRIRAISLAKMSALGEMAAGIAHEINNPLAIIHGRASQLKERIKKGDMSSTSAATHLEKIEETALRISKIVKGLRSFSRNAEQDPYWKVSVKQVIEDTLELCRERFKNHNIEVRLKPIPDVRIECRASQISQVLLNLLSNAYDAVVGEPESWIEVGVDVNEDHLHISVTDSGPGIPPTVAEKMMQPFFTTKEVGKGTGLGLSISKGIVEDHGGNLIYEAHSRPTKFIVDLPLVQNREENHDFV